MIDLTSKRLPDTVEVDGSLFSIKTDFRVWLRFDAELNKASEDYTPNFGFVFYDSQIIDEPLFMALVDFYVNSNKYPISSGKSEIVYSYLEDSDYILSEFRAKYGINLLTVDMHWHEFIALFRGLFVSFSQIVSYRSYEGTDKQYNDLKAKWRIQNATKKDSNSQRIEEILLNGGDLSQLGR